MGTRCSCNCSCPYRSNRKQSMITSCLDGYTKLCPLDASFCPSSSATLCPVKEKDEEHSNKEFNRNIGLNMQSVIPNVKIKVHNTKFTCKLTLLHSRQKVNLKASDVRCTPAFPRVKKVAKVKVKSEGFTFLVDININPSKIRTATILEAPTAATTTTAST